jgi:hypothetical protein
MAKALCLGSEVKAPEIYRNSPFEYVLTAEMGQAQVVYAKPLPAAQQRVIKVATVQIAPPLPAWMSVAQPGVKDKTTP